MSEVAHRDLKMRKRFANEFLHEHPQTEQNLVVVGGGITGILYATEWIKSGHLLDKMSVLEKENLIGGIWMAHANYFSRVQTAEPAYRLPLRSKRPGPVHQTYSHELMLDLHRLVVHHGLVSRIHTHANVDRAARLLDSQSSGRSWVVAGRQPDQNFRIHTTFVVLCINRRLSTIPNEVHLQGNDVFGGHIRLGLHNDTLGMSYKGKHVLILGFGAYAVENLRHGLESEASHVQILCRRRGTVCPKPVDWCNYVRPRDFDRGFRRQHKGNARLWKTWVDCYSSTGAIPPECWDEGKVKPDGHGISVADIFFVAHHLKRANTLVESIDHLERRKVITSKGGSIDSDIVLVCIGFKENFASERITGHSHMTCSLQGIVDEGCYVHAEAFLDSSDTENVFGMSVIMGATYAAHVLFFFFKGLAPQSKNFPRDRIGRAKASNFLVAGDKLHEHEVRVRPMLKRFLDEIQLDFLFSSSPYQFFERSKQEWGDYHLALDGSLKNDAFSFYPFMDLLNMIAEEDPDLVNDIPSRLVPPSSSSKEVDVVQALPVPEQAVTLDHILAITRNVIGTSNVDPDTPLLETGLDSLGAIALHQSLQDAVGNGVEVPASFVFEFSTPRSMFNRLDTNAPIQAITSGDTPTDAGTFSRVSARPALDLDELLRATRRVMGGAPVDVDTILLEAGLDSIGAASLHQSLQDAVGSSIEVPASLMFDFPTPRLLASALVISSPLTIPNQPQRALTRSVMADQGASAGWVPQNRRLMGLLMDNVYPTVWYSFNATLEIASAYFEAAPSLRTSFSKDKYTTNWRWTLRSSLPVYDRTCDTIPWTDQAVTFFYEKTQGFMWANHSVWDAFSFNYLASAYRAGLRPKTMSHWSVHELRVSKLHLEWSEGNEIVDNVLSAPTLFEDVSRFEYLKRLETLPDSVIQMVKRLSALIGARIESTWYAVIVAVALQCAGKSSASFWTQLSNRDSENMDVMGYVTSEPGFVFKATLGMALEHRTRQCLEPLLNVTTQHRNVFHEIAAAHPMNKKFLWSTVGLNYLGDEGPDLTDRSFLPEGANAFGEMSWIEIGSAKTPLIQFQGRQEIVQFCADVLLPELTRISQPYARMVLQAQEEAQLTVYDRMALSDEAIFMVDHEIRNGMPVPEQVDFMVVGAGLAGLTIATQLQEASVNFVVVEKARSVGGQWRYNAKASFRTACVTRAVLEIDVPLVHALMLPRYLSRLSRVNSSEPSYRLLGVDRPKNNTNHSHHHEIMFDILRLLQQHSLTERIYTLTEVTAAKKVDDFNWLLKGRQQSACFLCHSQVTALCMNRRLGTPRTLAYEGEHEFKGQIGRGVTYGCDVLNCTGGLALIIGMGAFAVECVRSALERRASHCTVLARQRGSVAPQIADWIRFIRTIDPVTFRTDSVGDSVLFLKWQELYDNSTASRPECWAQGSVKPDGHTLSVSDIFFVAHALGVLVTYVGEIDHCTHTGVVARGCAGNDSAHDGIHLACTMLIKCVGFEINEGNERVLGRSNGRLQTSLWLLFEPHLDNDFFKQLFVTSGLMTTTPVAGHFMILFFRTRPQLPDGPTFRINHVKASEIGEKFFECMIEYDPQGRGTLYSTLLKLAHTFNDTMSPAEYIVHNSTLWDQLHDFLRLHQGTSSIQPNKGIAYSYKDVLSELPDTRSWQGPYGETVSNGKLYDLLDLEFDLTILTTSSIDTLTFFDGSPPMDMLRERLRMIARANPWLAGRLCSADGGGVRVWVPPAEQASLHLEMEDAPDLSPNLEVHKAILLCSHLSVRIGLKCIDNDEALFKVSVLNTCQNQFALHVSMSHTVADAFTYYAIYTMLDFAESAMPPSLAFDRVQSFNTKREQVLGPDSSRGSRLLKDSRPRDVRELLKVQQASVDNEARSKTAALHLVDEDWIRFQKAANAGAAKAAGFDFISTNDILSSWFFDRSTWCSIYTMPVDSRGRLADISSKNPGNYLVQLRYTSMEDTSPVGVRKKLADLVERLQIVSAGGSVVAPPKPIDNVVGSNRVANITNWTGAYHHLGLPGCLNLVHYPVSHSLNDMTSSHLYLFRPRPGLIGGVLFAKENDMDAFTGPSSPFKPWNT